MHKRPTRTDRDSERAPAKTGKGFGDRYDGRANTNAGSPGSQVHERDDTPRIIRWAKSTP